MPAAPSNAGDTRQVDDNGNPTKPQAVAGHDNDRPEWPNSRLRPAIAAVNRISGTAGRACLRKPAAHLPTTVSLRPSTAARHRRPKTSDPPFAALVPGCQPEYRRLPQNIARQRLYTAPTPSRCRPHGNQPTAILRQRPPPTPAQSAARHRPQSTPGGSATFGSRASRNTRPNAAAMCRASHGPMSFK